MAQSKPESVDDFQGFQILRLHYSADPEKDEAWAQKQKKEYPSDTWEREFELKPVGHMGNYPVYNDYHKARHESSKLVYNKSCKLVIRGWDFGKVHPCVEFLQIDGLHKNFIGECYGDNIQLPQFCQMVLEYSALYFPGAQFRDWVDATGKNERDNGLPSVQILRQHGFIPKWRMQDVEEGTLYIQKALVHDIGGRPELMVNPTTAPHLATMFRGGLKRDKHGKIIKDGTHDHPADAARYAMSGIVTGKGSSNAYDASMDKIRNYKYKANNPFTGY